MDLHKNDIAQIVSMVWESVLGIECTPAPHAPPMPKAGVVAACVQITGGWQGAVVIACGETLAARAATIMFDTPVEDHTASDMQDAIAELTNMIGGNFKGLLPVSELCQLSLPAVVTGGDYSARIPGSRPVHQLTLNCGDDAIVVTILEKSAAARAA